MRSSFTYSLSPPHQSTFVLLEQNRLISDDIDSEKLKHFVGLFDQQQLIGVGGVEYFGKHSLLRSLAVQTDYQGRGIGSELIDRLERYAASLGVTHLYLLTHTAERLFLAAGYKRLERNKAPDEIARSNQFDLLCPADSTFMFKSLAG